MFTTALPPRGQNVVVYRGSFMPPKFHNKMVYSEVWSVSTAGGIQGYVYKMNSIYDPFSGAGGDGCYGIDEMQAIYDRYRVTSALITVTASATADKEPTMLYVYPSADGTTPTETIAKSAPACHSVMLAEYLPMTISFKEPVSRWLMNVKDYDASAASNADPAKLAYFGLLIQNVTAAALGVVLRVQITYDVEWSVLKLNNDTDA
jgi:hypothetical protein